MSKIVKADVLAYMTRENRPFSVNDVVGALQKAHGKTAVARAIDELVLEESLVEKSYGKQKVFVVPQDKLPRPDDSELKAMDEQIVNLSKKLQQLKDSIKSTESQLKSLESSLSLEEAQAQNARIEAEVVELRKLISQCDTGNSISPEDFAKIESKRKTAVAEWKKRKGMAMNILDAISEGYPKSRKQLLEDVGIETDEDRGVSLADFT